MLGTEIGHRVIELEETDSTNSHASRILHDEVPEEGTIVLTQFQKAGRGQRGSLWESERGKNLLASYILYPTFLHPGEQFVLSQAIALAVKDTIHEITGRETVVKWPND